jgi:serine/threonine-protein kinase
VQRFLQEARVSAKIQSPHVVRVSDVEQTPNGLPFMVMDFLKGRSLQTLYEDNYRAGVRLSYAEALEFAMQMLDGLEAAHEEGIVHRDLKPDNVMVVTGKRGDQVMKLLDFGIAKLKVDGEINKGLTRPGVIMGTPEYMAPEQVFSADSVDGRADVFSAGVMIFEMLAGRRPVGGDEAHQIAAAYISGNIAKLTDLAPSVPAELAAVVHKAMAADPKDRIATVQELRAGIAPFAREVGLRTSGSTPPPSPTGLKSNGTAVLVAGGAAANESLGGVAVSPVDYAETAKVSEPWRGDDVAAISAKLAAAGGANFESTLEAQPFFPGSTEAYQPAAHVMSQQQSVGTPNDPLQMRPGGTDVGAAMLPSTADFASTHLATGPAVAPPVVASYGPTAIPGAAPTARRKNKGGLSLVAILGIASAFTALVVGGVYAYEQYGGTSSKSEKTKTVPLPAKTSQPEPEPQPQPQPQPQPNYQPQPTPQPVSQPPQASTKPSTPGPLPSTKPTATTTNTVPILPSAFPPGIPTTLPIPTDWGIPGMNPQPQPQPTTKPSKPGGPKLEPIKRGALEAPKGPTTATAQTETANRPTRPAASRPVGSRPVLKPAQPQTAQTKPGRKVNGEPTKTASEGRVLKPRLR